jgi:hypothetical protein
MSEIVGFQTVLNLGLYFARRKFLSFHFKGGIMINPKSVALVLFAVAFGFASVAVQADPPPTGEWTPFTLKGTFVDKKSGNTYDFQIEAYEDVHEEGVGQVFFQLNGPRLSLTTVNKGWNPDTTPPPPQALQGHPLALIMGGSAGHQAVDIGEKVVEISAHAFVHSDAPNIVFIGPVTVDVRVEDTAGKIHVEIYSPKGKTKLEGKFTTP